MDPEFTNEALDLAADEGVLRFTADEIKQYYTMVAAHQAQILADFRAKFGDAALLAMIRAFHPGYQTTAEQSRAIRRTLHAEGVKPPRRDT